jgi:hypothetical protein
MWIVLLLTLHFVTHANAEESVPPQSAPVTTPGGPTPVLDFHATLAMNSPLIWCRTLLLRDFIAARISEAPSALALGICRCSRPNVRQSFLPNGTKTVLEASWRFTGSDWQRVQDRFADLTVATAFDRYRLYSFQVTTPTPIPSK